MDRILRAQDSYSFGRLLRQERKVLGKSQEDVAKAIGTRRQTIADLENGRNVGSHLLFAVLAALGKMVSISDARPDIDTIRQMMEEGDD